MAAMAAVARGYDVARQAAHDATYDAARHATWHTTFDSALNNARFVACDERLWPDVRRRKHRYVLDRGGEGSRPRHLSGLPRRRLDRRGRSRSRRRQWRWRKWRDKRHHRRHAGELVRAQHVGNQQQRRDQGHVCGCRHDDRHGGLASRSRCSGDDVIEHRPSFLRALSVTRLHTLLCVDAFRMLQVATRRAAHTRATGAARSCSPSGATSWYRRT